ncbi:cupin domain-containing protein [Kineosporia sp. NBRC 101731]|uniref:JmjC domain-containing protein n=1 Tax=Kineosporia sp. NBRC 101731 TaxID=3032199 RepID=UPI0024A2B50F|nr:cupin domain-containing protein [Kineosporia sp. NBRC 101731]GLY33857.1 hypothetical protein Kisp02_72220 [Kineosporia sp. NBRC 101731]
MTSNVLSPLVEAGGVLNSAYHGAETVLLEGAVDIGGLPGVGDILAWIEGSLLRRPYFAVLHEGVRPPDSEVLATRTIDGTKVNGFVDPAGVRRQLDAGATLKLNQIEDWHPLIRTMNDQLNAIFPAESKAYLFYTPAGRRGMLPHRDGSRVIAVQLAGVKEWHLYAEPEQAGARAGLDVDTSNEHIVLLRPGDVLYLPHGYGHAATAVDGTSLHLTFTLAEPTPAALARAYIAQWVASGGPERTLGEQDPQASLAAVKALLDDLGDSGRTDGDMLLQQALQTVRTKDAS